MNEFISVNDAVSETGKSVSSVRRALKKMPPESVRKQGKKYFYEREALFKELGLEDEPESVVNEINESEQIQTHSTDSEVAQTDSLGSQLIEAYRSQIQMQDAQIQNQQNTINQLLERLREANILVNTYQQRQLTVQESTPVGKTADEKKKETGIALASIGVLIVILGIAIYFSWHPLWK